jgi:6-phosphogluconate dehydrogenase
MGEAPHFSGYLLEIAVPILAGDQLEAEMFVEDAIEQMDLKGAGRRARIPAVA